MKGKSWKRQLQTHKENLHHDRNLLSHLTRRSRWISPQIQTGGKHVHIYQCDTCDSFRDLRLSRSLHETTQILSDCCWVKYIRLSRSWLVVVMSLLDCFNDDGRSVYGGLRQQNKGEKRKQKETKG